MQWIRTAALAVAAAAVAAGSAPAADYKAGALVITQPWSRATPGGASTAVGYTKITNAGGEPDRLTGATVGAAAKVSMHSMATKNGVMEMRELPDGIAIPPHGAVDLKPGGLHLMLDGLTRPLKKGDTVPGTLVFERAGTVPVTFAVQPIGAGSPPSDMKGMPME